MRFRKGERYRHKNCIDVDIEVIHEEVFHEDYTILKVFWLNRNYENGNYVINRDKVKIKKEHYQFWSEL